MSKSTCQQQNAIKSSIYRFIFVYFVSKCRYVIDLTQLDRVSVDTIGHDPMTMLHHLLRTVMVPLAQRLQVRWVMEQIKIALVGLAMVDDIGRRDVLSDQAELTQGLQQ
jgi:hypothetical protein